MEVQEIHEFTVDEANSPEEALSVAEEWFRDGEDGEVISVDVYDTDVYPVDSKEDN
jgi:hypothetical protein